MAIHAVGLQRAVRPVRLKYPTMEFQRQAATGFR